MFTLKQALLPIILFVNELDKALADRKLSFLEVIGLVPETASLAEIWPILPSLKSSYENLGESDKYELIALLEKELQLDSQKTEATILNALKIVDGIHGLLLLRKR